MRCFCSIKRRYLVYYLVNKNSPFAMNLLEKYTLGKLTCSCEPDVFGNIFWTLFPAFDYTFTNYQLKIWRNFFSGNKPIGILMKFNTFIHVAILLYLFQTSFKRRIIYLTIMLNHHLVTSILFFNYPSIIKFWEKCS